MFENTKFTYKAKRQNINFETTKYINLYFLGIIKNNYCIVSLYNDICDMKKRCRIEYCKY